MQLKLLKRKEYQDLVQSSPAVQILEDIKRWDLDKPDDQHIK